MHSFPQIKPMCVFSKLIASDFNPQVQNGDQTIISLINKTIEMFTAELITEDYLKSVERQFSAFQITNQFIYLLTIADSRFSIHHHHLHKSRFAYFIILKNKITFKILQHLLTRFLFTEKIQTLLVSIISVSELIAFFQLNYPPNSVGRIGKCAHLKSSRNLRR